MARFSPVEREQHEQETEVTRRSFLRRLMWGSVGLVAALFSYSGLRLFWPNKIRGFGSVIRAGTLDDFPVGSVTRIRDGRFYISRISENEIIALYWRCPHLGCTVPFEEQQNLFVCPCHGSVYEKTGQNIAGPAPRPMDYMRVEIRGNEVYVDTGDIRERSQHQPAHVTRIR